MSEPEKPADQEYRLADPERPAVPSDVAPVPPPAAGVKPNSTFEPAVQNGNDQDSLGEFPAEPPNVTEVWSRWTDWKMPVFVAAGGLVLATLIVFGGPWVATLMFFASLVYGAYFIVISLEVPVRVTPEQAVQEYYAAAAHRLPNFRRMYALLTADGKQSTEFSDYATFCRYWKTQIGRMSKTPTWFVPLELRIDGFKYRYNDEKNLASVRYTLKVSPRSRSQSQDATAEFDMRNLTVKGPDGQWYLNDGTLPDPD